MSIFLLIASCVWGAFHAYVVIRLQRSLPSKPGRRWLRIGFAALWATTPAAFVLGRVFPNQIDPFLWVAFLYMGFFVILLLFLAVQDAFWALARLAERPLGKSFVLDRREFLGKLTNSIALGASGVLSGVGVYQAKRLAKVVEQPVAIAGLPDSLVGYRIAQISDLHVGPNLRVDWLRQIVEKVNGLDADVVAITGDLIDGTVDALRDDVAPLKSLRARDGVFFVTGNHEYYWDGPAWCEHLKSLGLSVLLNEHSVIDREDARVVIAGCTDFSAARFHDSHTSDPEAALADAPLADVRILLAHQPKSIDAAVRAGADLQLSGHTHGGQFFPMSLLVGFAHPFSRGLGKRDNTWIYVNPGTGYWGPPLRQGVPAEITLLRLESA